MSRVKLCDVLIEEQVVGAFMLNPNEFDKYELKSEYFASECKLIYEKMLKCRKNGLTVEMSNVLFECSDDEEVLYDRIVDISTKVITAFNLKKHVDILHRLYNARTLYDTMTISMSDILEYKDIGSALEKLEQGISATCMEMSTEAVNMDDSVDFAIEQMCEVLDNRIYIPTGFFGLDRLLNGGFKYPDLIVIGGRPSMGKSQFAIHFAESAARANKNVLFVSIEMTKEQIVKRMLCEREGVTMERLNHGDVSSRDVAERAAYLRTLPINILDTPDCRNISTIKRVARKYSRKGMLDFLIIDYLQLIRTDLTFGTRDLQIGYITSELKNLAKELRVPVMILAQVGRPPKGEKVFEPSLSDLRESGNIEQDADVVIFPHRPTYYNPSLTEWENKGELILAKQREGVRMKNICFEHDEQFKRIWECEDIQEQRYEQRNANEENNGYVPF
ncbi:MAG: hypothetical protein MJZ98_00475 [Paludibacteraceae bacterium]|nr:hypothetical protein [Paludibacteraceae bacterium]